MVYCSRCGCYAEQRAKHLKDRCTGKQTQRSRTFCTHWEAGRHPHNFREVEVVGRVRLCIGTLQGEGGTGLGGGSNPPTSPGATTGGVGTLRQRSQAEVRRALLRCALDDPDWEPIVEVEEEEPMGEAGPFLSPPSQDPFADGPG